MTIFRTIRPVFEQALAGGVAAKETRTLVNYCAFLALPLVRKRVRQGLLNLGLLAMTEEDIVYDALAELFRRDDAGTLTFLRSSFRDVRIEDQSDEEIVDQLRKLVFVNVHKTIIRLYSETDPTMAKILRNVKLGIAKSNAFEEAVLFGETVLVILGREPLFGQSRMGSEELQQAISSIVNVHDTIPAILTKLHTLLSEQDQHQRVVPLFQLAATIKSVYVIGWETEQVAVPTVEDDMDSQHVRELIVQACAEEAKELRRSYVESGKIPEELLSAYVRTIESIIKEEYFDAVAASRSYYDHLVAFVPAITYEKYRAHHRTTLEYITKKTRLRVQQRLKKL